MKTHNAVIFHCQSCGSISHCDCNTAPPVCCGREMVRAAGETVCDENGVGKVKEQLPFPKKEIPATSPKPR